MAVNSAKRQYSLQIWLCAFGYFLTYIPYSALTKTVTSGLWHGTPISGFELLIPAAAATLFVEFFFISIMGWWRYLSYKRIFGFSIPQPRTTALISGLGYAAIILTTTLTYSLNGVSILLALLLMRGGVLIIAPVIDRLFWKPVRWFSWAGLLLSVAALLCAFSNIYDFHLGISALVVLTGYLTGYATRLPSMSQRAKNTDRINTLQYFVEEQLVAMPAILLAPVFWTLVANGDTAHSMKYVLFHFVSAPATMPGLLIGICYAGLGTFCTFIYLDPRENSFCVPIYSCSSLLSGVVASYGLHFFLDAPSPSTSELVASLFMMSALLVLSPLHHIPEKLAHSFYTRQSRKIADGSWVEAEGREAGA
jgi:hypothetical protein